MIISAKRRFPEGLANFQKRHADMDNGNVFVNDGETRSIPYAGQPYFVSEFGGFKWVPESEKALETGSWGYGGGPTSEEDFYHRFDAVCQTLLDNRHMFGYCYTQLTDIYPELNGIFTFDRKPKFDAARLKASQTKQAAMEKQG